MILHSGSIFLLFHALKKSLRISCKRKFTKFKKIHLNLKINIPVAYALAEILHYAKLLKGSLKKRAKLMNNAWSSLVLNVVSFLQSKIPPKPKNPKRILIPRTISDFYIKKALCDLG